ncbi:peptidylprolyl isomerase [Gilliamella sp. HK2]|uniref:peptidylprolyl isomerase n=1 Tax=unclassified Gilliamella TaxID=2685620 RepID=UPI00080EA740|nr:peptidylprolyl isomerase [Gilliamella apicola]OCG27238.1 peptidylprolyl isomerase [Gilliamella apicola]OCG31974.1 peptidylprolyl isomerase [Gilliamella apicola]
MNRRLFIGGCLGFCAGSLVVPSALKWLYSKGDVIEMKLNNGIVTMQLFPDFAPNHVARIKALVQSKFYDGMPFARVIDGFMAQTGEPLKNTSLDPSILTKLAAEINPIPFERGTLGMARSRNPHSASHQFFITLARTRFLDQNHTVFGKVINGMELVDQLRSGDAEFGMVSNPEVIKSMRLVTSRII